MEGDLVIFTLTVENLGPDTATNVVLLDPDVASVFPDSDSVNRALRSLLEIIARQRGTATG